MISRYILGTPDICGLWWVAYGIMMVADGLIPKDSRPSASSIDSIV